MNSNQSYPSDISITDSHHLKPPRHMAGIDLVRIFAALTVMAYHLAYWTWNSPVNNPGRKILGTDQLTYPDLAPFTSFGWVGVHIFFVISGLVICFSAAGKSPAQFFIGRLTRLLPAIWICATITLLLLSIRGQGDITKYVRALFIVPYGPWIDGVYWTLTIEIVFYALIFLALVLAPTRIPHLLVAIGAASTCFHMATWAQIPWAIAFADTRHAQMLLLSHGSYFALGGMLWLISARGFTVARGLASLAFFMGCSISLGGSSIPAMAVWQATFLCILASVYWNRKVRWARAAEVLGAISYPLYLLHNVGGAYVMRLLSEFGAAAALAGAVLVVLIVSYAVSLLEGKIRKSLQQSLYGSRLKPAA